MVWDRMATSVRSFDTKDNNVSDDVMKDEPVNRYFDSPPTAQNGPAAPDEFRDEDTAFASPSLYRTSDKKLRVVAFVVVLVAVGLVAKIVRDRMVNRPKENALEFLTHHRITSAAAFSNQDSYQSMALHWMIYEDPLKLSQKDPGFIQRYIVSTLAYAIVVPAQNVEWLRSDMKFLSGYHECDWSTTWDTEETTNVLFVGITCDDSRKVTKIVMPGLGLNGRLPTELKSLDHLTDLMLDTNEITGFIPYVPTLTTLSLAYNNIEGKLSSNIGLVHQLEEFVLTENLLSGALPSEFAKLTKLRRLSMGGNEITGGIQNLFHLTELEEIYAGFNSFDDSLDPSSFAAMTNLRILDLKHNRIQGRFPAALWTLPSLQVVDFQFNALEGQLEEIDESPFPVLEYLDISENFLSGSLPATLDKLTTLKHLDISSNRFDEPIAADYRSLTNLKTLLMTENTLIGPAPIPGWLAYLSNLEHLSLKLTARTGIIPSWFFDSLTKLKTLDMDSNHISGNIPSNIGQATELEYLLLNRNRLNGTVPTSLQSLPNLKILMIDNNHLLGEIQSCQADIVVADCGDPSRGCPNCDSNTKEVACLCCTRYVSEFESLVLKFFCHRVDTDSGLPFCIVAAMVMMMIPSAMRRIGYR